MWEELSTRINVQLVGQLANPLFEFQDVVDLELKAAEVVRRDTGAENVLDDWEQVIQGANGLERWRMGWTGDTAGGSENERIFDGRQGDTAIVEFCGKKPIVAMDNAGSCRRSAIGVKNDADVIDLWDVHGGEVQL